MNNTDLSIMDRLSEFKTSSKSKLKSLLFLRFFDKEIISELNGSKANLQDLVAMYLDDPEVTRLYSYALNDEQRQEAYSKFLEITELKGFLASRIWAACPELIGVFYIFTKHPIDSYTFEFLDNYYFNLNIVNRAQHGYKYIEAYLDATINPLLSKKYYCNFTENDNIIIYHVTNKVIVYSFKNLWSIKDIVNTIFKEDIGYV